MTWVDDGREMSVALVEFSKAFDSVSHNILAGKIWKCELDEWTLRCIENWLTDRAQRVVSTSEESSLRPVANGVP